MSERNTPLRWFAKLRSNRSIRVVFARTRLPEEDGQAVPLLDGVAKLVQRYLVGFSVIVGGVVSQLEGLVPKSVVLAIHNVRLLLREMKVIL